MTAERSSEGLEGSTPALALCGVTAGYGSVPVVRDLDVRIEAGELVAILGANGAGKTTTLLTAVGQLAPLAGEVRVFGTTVSARRPSATARLGVATVPDSRGLFLQLSVRENLRLVHPARAPLADVLAAFPALSPLMGRRCGLLSGGEQQMLALAKALLARPRLLVIDEMSHGLAPLVAERLFKVVRSLADDHQMAVLLVEQHIGLALSVADRAYVLAGGGIALSGSTASLAEDPGRVQSAYLGGPSASDRAGGVVRSEG